MTRAEWLTIIAIVVGPILALGAQRALDSLRETRKRRVELFITLMTTRASPLAFAHVQALNSIDVIFKEPGDQAIRDAWHRVRDQMDTDPARPGWVERVNDLKVDLYQAMGKAVDFDFSTDYLKHQAYLPRHYTDLEQDQLVLRQMLLKVLTDTGVKVVVTKYTETSPPMKDSS